MPRLVLSSLAAGLVALALTPAAHAQATRTWVSGVGDDANPCSRTAPCKTFAGAISKTATGGIINVLDPGGFGGVTITKSITIDGYSGHAGILVSGTNAINVNGAGIKVILRHLSIEGIGTGLAGINWIAGAQLTIENCSIFGFQGGSTPTAVRATLSTSGELLMKDTNITDSGVGVHLQTSGGQLLATLDNVRIENMTTHGLQTAGAGSTFVTVKRSTINNNNSDGVRAGGGATIITLEENMLAFNNGTAVNAAVSGARIRISNNTIVNNSTGVGIAAGAIVETAGNNRIDGNSASAAPNDTFNLQ
jgi:hypothetical protein